MTVPWDVLVVSSDLERRRELTSILRRENVDAICASTVAESLEIQAKGGVGLIFCDGRLSDGNYRDLLIASRAIKSRARVVITSKDAGWDEYLEAIRLGAFDVIAFPYRPTDVEWMVIQAKRDERTRSRQELSIGYGHSSSNAHTTAQA